MNNVKCVKIGIVIITIAVIIFFSIYTNSSSKIKVSPINLADYNFSDRVTMFSQDEFVVGENKAQLENGYWDFKFTKQSDGKIKLYINKLWYGEYNDTILDSDYLYNLVEYIRYVAKSNNLSVEDNIVIYRSIETDYLSLKCSEDNTVQKILEYNINSDGTCLSVSKGDK